jgi:hypothetical protein
VIHEIAASTQIIDMPLWVGLTARTISYATITIISTVRTIRLPADHFDESFGGG